MTRLSSTLPRLALGVGAVFLAAVGGCRDRPSSPPVAATPQALAEVSDAFDECVHGDIETGLADLSAVLDQSPRDPDALVARGLCRWARWGDSGDESDARDAYRDLSDAIEAVDSGARPGTPLGQIYSHRAFVAHSLDQAWVRAIEDLDRAVEIAPGQPTHVLDRGVAHLYAGNTTAARADLGRFLVLTEDTTLVQEKRVVQALLDGLDSQLTDTP